MMPLEFSKGDVFRIIAKDEAAIVIAVEGPGEVEEDWYHLLDTSNWAAITSESLPREDFGNLLSLMIGSEVIE